MPGEDIKLIKTKLKDLEDRLKLMEEKNSLLGFKFVRKKNKYWYGYRSIKGKIQWVYIGKDKSKADVKIIQWMGKKLERKKNWNTPSN